LARGTGINTREFGKTPELHFTRVVGSPAGVVRQGRLEFQNRVFVLCVFPQLCLAEKDPVSAARESALGPKRAPLFDGETNAPPHFRYDRPAHIDLRGHIRRCFCSVLCGRSWLLIHTYPDSRWALTWSRWAVHVEDSSCTLGLRPRHVIRSARNARPTPASGKAPQFGSMKDEIDHCLINTGGRGPHLSMEERHMDREALQYASARSRAARTLRAPPRELDVCQRRDP